MNTEEFEADRRRNTEQRRAMIKCWGEYVRSYDDEGWSCQQNRLINAQLQSANEMAAASETDPVRFTAARDRLSEQ